MNRSTKQIAIPTVLIALAAVAIWSFFKAREESEKEHEEEGIHSASRVSHTPDGHVVIKLDKETRERIALKTAKLDPASWTAELVAFGVLLEDPARVFNLRAPLAGFIREDKSKPWPGVGQSVADGELVGHLAPRFGPMDRVDLMARLSSARADVKEDEAELLAAKASYENKKKLNTENKIVSDRTLEGVEAKVKAWEARLASAKDNVVSLEDALDQTTGPGQPLPLKAERGGDVAEVLAEPGEAVESGQALLRIARYDRLIARVELPAGQHWDFANAKQPARVTAPNIPNKVFAAEPIGTAPDVDAKTRGQGIILRVPTEGGSLRPGMAVTAYLPTGGVESKGVCVPRSAIVRSAGAAWVYVRTGDDTFERRQVDLAHPAECGWHASHGFAAGDEVVVDGAQVLLSEELKSQFESEAE